MRSLRVRSTPHPGHLPTPCTKHDLCTKLLPLIKCGFKLCILYVRNGGRYGGLWIRTCEHRRFFARKRFNPERPGWFLDPVSASVFPNVFLCATVHAGGAFELPLSSTSCIQAKSASSGSSSHSSICVAAIVLFGR